MKRHSFLSWFCAVVAPDSYLAAVGRLVGLVFTAEFFGITDVASGQCAASDQISHQALEITARSRAMTCSNKKGSVLVPVFGSMLVSVSVPVSLSLSVSVFASGLASALGAVAVTVAVAVAVFVS